MPGYWSKRPNYVTPDAASARAFAEPKAKLISEFLELRGDERILDVGAGTGHLTVALAKRGHPLVATDMAHAMLIRNPASRRAVADAGRLPFPDASFDVVVESNLLHHIEDPVGVLREMARVSRGKIGAVEPNRNHPPMFLFSLLVKEEWKGLRFTPGYLRRLAERARLDVKRVFPTGWVYQNKTPNWLAGPLSKFNGRCALAAYTVGAFRKENRP